MGVQISGDTGNVLATKGTYTGNLTIGGVLTYEDVTNVDSVGLITARSGIKVTSGDIAMDTAGNITLGDSGASTDDRLVFGASSDLSIYHDGSNSYIDDSGTGNLYLRGSASIELRKAGGTEKMLYAEPDAQVELYYDNSKKFQTYTNGIQFFGNIKNETDGTNQGMFLGAANDFQFYHDGNRSAVNNRTGDLRLLGAGNIILGRADSNNSTSYDEQYISCTSNGAVELYHNNNLKITTTSEGINVTQGANNFSNFHHGGGNSGIRIAGPAASSGANLLFANNFDNTVSDEWAIQLDGSSDDLLFLEGGAGGTEVFRIKSDRDFVETLSGNDTTKFNQTSSSNNIFKTLMYHRSASGRGDVSFIKIGENSTSAGEIRLKTSASNSSLSGGVYISGGGTSFGSLSDTRLKNKISDIADALTNINKIDTWKYSWTHDSANTPHLGVTAQSVNSVFPEVVNTTKGLQDESDETEYYGVLYTELIPVCIAAIKELSAENTALKARLDAAGL